MPDQGCHRSENETAQNALLQQVAALESEMEDTRAQIAQKQAFLLEQEQERRRLDTQLNALSPIDQLPAEVKTEIFYSVCRNPFFLGKICRGWRDFVWSSPVLWTNIHLEVTKKNRKVQANLLRDWLSRTAGCPLTFCLALEWSHSRHHWNGGSSFKQILTMLASVSTQWKEVEFFLPNSQVCFDAISTAENSLPLLTDATVDFDFDSGERPFNLFSVAPQLSTLCIDNNRLANVLAPWHQIKDFTSFTISLDDVRGFLQKAPNVIRCTVDDDGSESIQGEPQDTFVRPLVLERLEYLELQVVSEGVGITRLLESVELPALREVNLTSHLDYSSLAILPAIMISFCSSHLLETFTFTGSITSDDELIQVLRYIPSTKELSLDSGEYHPHLCPLLTEKLLQRLYPPHADILLPNLRSFTYCGPSTFDEHMHMFRDMLVYRFRQCALRPAEVDSKRATVSRIQSVTVVTASRLVISPDIQEELDCLVNEGLELSLTSTLQVE
ncbi:uncharacterized protein LACBIDRAFT_317225 [Laccaria bicolor S238N-H82]|uniref:Predicted protein n=1 Tax=Laccaria bicolor (strain S238N-H82 / ATCC MYA-4686) TaxID=486041 RepID=B0D4Q0_LACBS|nr:uncharacterized protein LACBIDRAFT_317225 [Laccaria bicolor S238N-H82]EDR10602.1 predicted protein [Laccaria bicolor S238N-H82]|eukprot:XP_001879052.1 predicted protein [Laccaria bicolor S238N-H82]